ncbi:MULTISPECIES: NADH-quinone oxidoreductase subunit C [unclassified Fibrobacter]
MAEARVKFKEENPDYKSAFKPVRVVKETFPEIVREPVATRGLSQAEMLKKLQEKFPSITVRTAGEDSVETTVQNMTADTPLEVLVDSNDYLAAVEFVKKDASFKMDYLIDVTAADYSDHFDLITMLRSMEHGHKLFFCTQLKKDENVAAEKRATALLAKVPTVSHLYPAAEVKEREVFDMFGIEFTGHQDLRRIFLDKDFVGYPLRKDFTHPDMIKRPV